MNIEEFLSHRKAASWSEINDIVDTLDTSSLSLWQGAIPSMNDYQVWVLVMSIRQKNQCMPPEFAIRILDHLPPEGSGIDVLEWIVLLTKPFSPDLVARLTDLAMKASSYPEREQIPAILVGTLGTLVMNMQSGESK